jgi:phosphoglycerate kinase
LLHNTKKIILPVDHVVSKRLEELLNKKVIFINKTRGSEIEDTINNMNNGDVLLLENTRIEDYPNKLESNNDHELSKYWASLGDIFINDAFAVSHRSCASIVGIASILPSGIGFLIQKELLNMLPVINNPKHPFVVIMGGSKVSDKIGVIDNLIDKCDYILIGGGMSYTFLKAKGMEIGKSLLEEDYLDYCKNLLHNTKKIILPVDHVVSKSMEDDKPVIKENIDTDDIALDIGPETIKLFREYLDKAETIIWNGPVGMYENKLYQNGTKSLCESFNKDKTIIIGGGDTAACINTLGYSDRVTHISTGGGASLELLEGKDLPGIKVIGE